MSRKKKIITIEDNNRDKGKTFVLTELASYEAEQWVWQLIPVLGSVGFEVNDDTLKGGFGAIAAMGAAAILRMPYQFTKSLLDAMLPCIQYQHDPSHPLQPIYQDTKCQIEEVATWFKLRKAVLDLHIDPFLAAGGLNSQETPQPPRPAA